MRDQREARKRSQIFSSKWENLEAARAGLRELLFESLSQWGKWRGRKLTNVSGEGNNR